MMPPPAAIRTERLVVRAWRPGDAPLLKDAIDTSLPHLQRWLPWALSEPSAIDVIADRLRRFEAMFTTGREWLYGIFTADETRVLGGAGLHPRIDAGGLEIGYWLRADATGQGYATEAIGAITRAAFERRGTKHLEIRCDTENVRSAAIPRRLGYRHVRTVERATPASPGDARATMVWRLTREEFANISRTDRTPF